jgi:hypothetical protein
MQQVRHSALGASRLYYFQTVHLFHSSAPISSSLPAIERRSDGCKRSSSYDDIYWIRLGNYRVIYEIDRKRIIYTLSGPMGLKKHC